MSIRDGATVPIGIPAYFLRDQLAHAVDQCEILSTEPGRLLDEYADAWGYVFPWGHLIEQRSTWREPRPGVSDGVNFVQTHRFEIHHEFGGAGGSRMSALDLVLHAVAFAVDEDGFGVV
jgi:hypothetical protein